jgi:O-antigen ligase
MNTVWNLPLPPRWLVLSSSVALLIMLWGSILTMWITERWSINLFEAALLALGIVWAQRMVRKPYSFRTHPVLFALSGAVIVGLVQLATASTVNRWQTWNAVITWFAYLVSFSLALQVFCYPDTLASFRRALLYYAFALSVFSTIQYFSSEGKIFWIFQSGSTEGILGPFINRDHYAAFIELVLPIALFEGLRDRRQGFKAATMAAAMVASVIAGASRAGSVLVLAECAGVMLLARRLGLNAKSRTRGVFASTLALCIVAFGMAVGWGRLRERLRDPDPYLGRREMLLSAVAMTRARPWTGFGLGGFADVYPAYGNFDSDQIPGHAHNDWAEWAAEGGLPFLLCILMIAILGVPAATRSCWGLGIPVVLLHSLADYHMQNPALALWLFVLLGAACAGDARGGLDPSHLPAPWEIRPYGTAPGGAADAASASERPL